MRAWRHRFFGMHAYQGAGFRDAGTTAILCTPEMKYRASAVVLVALLVALPLSHLEISPTAHREAETAKAHRG